MATQVITCNSCGKPLNGRISFYCDGCSAYYCGSCKLPLPDSDSGGMCPNCNTVLQVANM